MSPIGAAFGCSKACDIIAEDGTFMRPRSRYEQICHLICRRNATKCQLVPVRIPSLLEQNVLKAVCRTQMQGSCKVYEGKTNWETLLKAVCTLARSEEMLYARISEVLSCAQKADMSLDISDKFQLVPVRSPTNRCSDCKKVWKARATSAPHGIGGRVESPG